MAIFEAIKNGKLDKIQELVKKESVLSKTDNNKNLPIHCALQYACELEFIKLLCKPEIVNSKNKDTPLHIATRFYQEEDGFQIIQYLIDQGADVNAQDKQTPLHRACFHGCSPGIIKLLLNNGSNPLSEIKKTPLHSACEGNQEPKVLKLLLDRISPKMVNKPISFKKNISKRNLQILSDFQNYCPLHLLVSNEEPCLESIQMLLYYGADPTLDVNGTEKLKIQDLYQSEEIDQIFIQFNSIIEDFGQLIDNSNLSDSKMNTTDFNSSIFEFRCERPYSTDCQRNLNRMEKDDMIPFREWLYTGESENMKIVKKVAKEIGISGKKIKKKTKKKGFLADLRKYYLQDKTKDFTIIAESKEIKVHKVVLAARSKYFRKFFTENPKQTSIEQSESYESWMVMIKFFYIDEIDDGVGNNHIEELREMEESLELNENSLFLTQLDLINLTVN
ncbi:ankyrin repeat [Anaeramoeba flamelloides]|uniref:Ankyrin repeat n=1 Tax=Anaeramoeba flamelloides TaxID=1746091 RepID=A0AAV7Z3G2_9EUKA|nr:ankyrin repeat ph and sec7 domain containing protein secg-related [Anaeramoeba flamelloides]KAJ6244513.1 ankyrin repeat [Anaeramoeba flamelloides]